MPVLAFIFVFFSLVFAEKSTEFAAHTLACQELYNKEITEAAVVDYRQMTIRRDEETKAGCL